MSRSNLLLAILSACLFGHTQCQHRSSMGYTGSPPIIIYNSTHDNHQQVSVVLSDDGTELLAFPDPADVAEQRPVALVDGYWLQRMTGNAFLTITIEEYQRRTAVDPQMLLDHVADATPFIEYYTCPDIANDTAYINSIIRQGHLSDHCQDGAVRGE